MNKIRKGDQVIVLTGRDKGRRGTVLSRVDEERLIVEGVNVVKKHVKPNPMKGITGGVIDKTLSIHQSNVAIFNRRPARPIASASSSSATPTRSRARPSSAAPACSARAAKRSRFKEALMARLARVLSRQGRPRPGQEVRLHLDDAGTAHHQDHAQHGRERGGVRTRR
jgi:ribosomal protein L24